ncbi:MAG: SDR family NAD(P)-dependent oxidoreductase [Bacteroidales bacterium]|nr:SDR family NAD(P)-dependent oxidoreductase [Bacteroidales bacterium]
MQFRNYIFTGFGMSKGKYKITNKDIFEAIEKDFLSGFSKEKITKSEKFKAYKEKNPNASPFDYFAGNIMGFYERNHVTPFPPTLKKLYYADTSLELGVEAIENALEDANISASEIDAWYLSTVSPQEQAPGIAARIKSFFVDENNHKPAFSLSSGCAGFNMNLEAALSYFEAHPEAKHIIIAHSETMSSFLTQRTKFVPFVTFGDAAAAVVLTKIESNEKFGIININNLHDLHMLDYVGVDNKRNLYMNDSLIKDRAIINIPEAANKCLNESKWARDEIDYFVPHQTGNVILLTCAKNLEIDLDKVFLDGQKYYGNVSGATVPLSLCLLKQQGKLIDNLKILSATAGVGGNFGAFSYIHKNIKINNNEVQSFLNKNILILGASGKIGLKLSEDLYSKGGNLFLQANQNFEKLIKFENSQKFICNFTDELSVEKFIKDLKNLNINFDYVINLASSVNENETYKVNFTTAVRIINSILPQIKNTLINIGSATEDIEFSPASDWTSANRAFHGYLASASGEFLKNGIKTIYLQIGFVEDGISKTFDEKAIFKFMLSVKQERKLKIEEISKIILKSLLFPKVLRLDYNYENAMLLGRIAYKLEVDV